MFEKRQEFRTPLWLTVLLGIGCGLSIVGALSLAKLGNSQWESIVLWCLAVFFVVAIIDARLTKVVLECDELKIISNFHQKTIPRTEVVRAVAEKGAPIALEKKDGSWVLLPETVSAPHPNTLRAWIKRGQNAS